MRSYHYVRLGRENTGRRAGQPRTWYTYTYSIIYSAETGDKILESGNHIIARDVYPWRIIQNFKTIRLL